MIKDECCYGHCFHEEDKYSGAGYRGLYDISQRQLAAEREKNRVLQAKLDALKAIINL
jgi:hypothetical protein